MLNSNVINQMNREIDRELTNYRFCRSQTDKLACLDRISKLKSLLNPSPTADEIADALVTAMSPEPPKPEPVASANLTPLAEAILAMTRFK